MKKLLIIAIIYSFLSCTIFAQDFFGGVIGGINASQVDGDDYSGYRKAGINAGGFVGYRFTERSGVRFGIEFSQKGARQNMKFDDEGNYYPKYLFRENCIDVPVTYQFYINRLFSADAGLSYSYLFNYYREYDGFENDYSDIRKSSLNMLLGFYINITQHLFTNLRFSYSLTPIAKATNPRTVSPIGINGQLNNMFTLSLGWNFGKGNKFN